MEEVGDVSDRVWLRCGGQTHARFGHTSCWTGAEEILTFGGTTDGANTFSEDLLAWDGASSKWAEPQNSTLAGKGRTFHTACWYQGAMWLFGGMANGYHNDVWRWTKASGWSKIDLDAEAKRPSPRWGHASVVVGDQWFIHGGFDSSSQFCDDLWSFDFPTRTWTRLPTKGKYTPGERQHHTLVTAGGNLYLWGGKNNSGACDATIYVLSLDTREWNRLKIGATNQPAPCARWGHSSVLVNTQYGPKMVVFGGKSSNDAFYNDLWSISLTNPPSGIIRVASGQRRRNSGWEVLSSDAAPLPRAFHSCVLLGEMLHIFGGRSVNGDAESSLWKICVTRDCHIAKLPSDVLLLIFERVPPQSLLKVAQVSRHWCRLSSDDRLWKPIHAQARQLWPFPPPLPVEAELTDKERSYKELTRILVKPQQSDFDLSKRTRVKLVTIGDGATGKTSMLIAFTEQRFPLDYVPTVFDNFTTQYPFQGRNVVLDLWDTAGPEEYSRLRRLSYPGTTCFLLLYAINRRTNYDNVMHKWVPEVLSSCPATPILLVGSKIDLRGGLDPNQQGEFCATADGESLVAQVRNRWPNVVVDYVECSALTGAGLKDVFEKGLSLSMGILGKDLGGGGKDKCILC